MPIRLSKPDIHDDLHVHAIKRISHITIARIYNKEEYFMEVDDIPGWRKNLTPIATGISKCSRKEQFNKLKGRIRSLAHALRMMKMFNDSNYDLENFHYDGHKIFAYDPKEKKLILLEKALCRR